MKLEFHIHRPPSVNNLFVNVPKKGRVPSKGYLAWQKRAGMAIAPQVAAQRDILPLKGPVWVALMVDKKNGDLANYDKAPLDLLTKHGVYEDDDQIERLAMYHDSECRDLMFIHVGPI